jgi:hypothetical protein
MIGMYCIHTLLALVVLPELHALKRGSAGNELVREVALVLLSTVHLTVSIVGFACIDRQYLTYVYMCMLQGACRARLTPAESHCEYEKTTEDIPPPSRQELSVSAGSHWL